CVHVLHLRLTQVQFSAAFLFYRKDVKSRTGGAIDPWGRDITSSNPF
ncbi:hypothetical protein A2U01_0115953, partial [Trifolium medium]|nr:hypothetical protein [Trifolium medium]